MLKSESYVVLKVTPGVQNLWRIVPIPFQYIIFHFIPYVIIIIESIILVTIIANTN